MIHGGTGDLQHVENGFEQANRQGNAGLVLSPEKWQ